MAKRKSYNRFVMRNQINLNGQPYLGMICETITPKPRKKKVK